MSFRVISLWIHRYTGLAIAAFLVIAGLTGSVIAFAPELDTWLNPELYGPASQDRPLPISELIERVEQADLRVKVEGIFSFASASTSSTVLYVLPRRDPLAGRPAALAINQLFADSTTGEIRGTRLRGACCFESKHVIPFLRLVHWSLFAGFTGQMFMGSVAAVWTLNCLVGLYLTLPRGRPFFARWLPAWKAKVTGGTHRVSFHLHRASALWSWGMLLVLAITSVALGLHHQIFRPLVSSIASLTPDPMEAARSRLRSDAVVPRLSISDAIAMAEAKGAEDGTPLSAANVIHFSGLGLYRVGLARAGEGRSGGLGLTYIYIDDRDGGVMSTQIPGKGTTGDVFLQLQYPLHTGQVAGMPGRIIVCVGGIVVAVISMTGVLIWFKNWQKRNHRPQRGWGAP